MSSDDGEASGHAELQNGAQMLALLRPRKAGSGGGYNRNPRWGKKRLAAQVRSFNRKGYARTVDYHMHDKGQQPSKPKGKGGWKRWTPEAILKAGSSDPTATTRSSTIVGGSHAGVIHSRAILAQSVLAGQERGLAAIVEGARKRRLDFYITNNMFDETKLPFGKPVSKKRPCLAWHSQVTWAADAASGHVEDLDVSRPPQILGSYTAAKLSQLLGCGSDTAGVCPKGEARPLALYHGSLLAVDTHSVNVLLSKWLPTVLDEKHFVISSFCTQHRTGSVCEEIGKQWGLLSPSFCLANRLQYGDFWDDLKEAVRAVLTKYLAASGPVEASGHDCGFEKALLDICHEARLSDNQDDDDDGEVAAGIRRRRAEVQEFLDFSLHLGREYLFIIAPKVVVGTGQSPSTGARTSS